MRRGAWPREWASHKLEKFNWFFVHSSFINTPKILVTIWTGKSRIFHPRVKGQKLVLINAAFNFLKTWRDWLDFYNMMRKPLRLLILFYNISKIFPQSVSWYFANHIRHKEFELIPGWCSFLLKWVCELGGKKKRYHHVHAQLFI